MVRLCALSPSPPLSSPKAQIALCLRVEMTWSECKGTGTNESSRASWVCWEKEHLGFRCVVPPRNWFENSAATEKCYPKLKAFVICHLLHFCLIFSRSCIILLALFSPANFSNSLLICLFMVGNERNLGLFVLFLILKQSCRWWRLRWEGGGLSSSSLLPSFNVPHTEHLGVCCATQGPRESGADVLRTETPFALSLTQFKAEFFILSFQIHWSVVWCHCSPHAIQGKVRVKRHRPLVKLCGRNLFFSSQSPGRNLES